MARTEILRAKTGHVLDIGAALAVILLGVWPLIRRYVFDLGRPAVCLGSAVTSTGSMPTAVPKRCAGLFANAGTSNFWSAPLPSTSMAASTEPPSRPTFPPPSRRQPERAAPKFLAFDTFPLPLYRERAAVA
ncbi:hypothetical protein X737_29765 [Mesorhizobium sp. L48C026A00]|nr:hypothetical protein X737_29765 [Mesorhizobium sp. L48C026A00]